jgi:hypothetical protein
VLVVCRDSRCDLANIIESAARQGYRGVISFGVAGGLAANLRTGDWVVASMVLDAHVPHATDVAPVQQPTKIELVVNLKTAKAAWHTPENIGRTRRRKPVLQAGAFG